MRIAFLFLTTAILSHDAVAEIKLPSLFQKSMVLQRDQPTKVWGWATPGSRVSVSIFDQSTSSTTDENGKWEVRLEPLSAGGPYRLKITGDHSEHEIEDILVGDVWLCSGQSNMAMTVSRARDFERESARANYPEIRMFRVTSSHATTPQEHCKGAWATCSPDSVGNFSATAYFFGRRLHRELNVPIGLINSSVGGTSVESWTSMPAQSVVASIKPRLDAWVEEDRAYDKDEAKARLAKAMARYNKQVAAAKTSPKKPPRREPQLADQPRESKNYPANLFNGKINPLIGYTIRGAIWYQGENSSRRGFSHLYRDQLTTLIRDWRSRWGQGDFPFAWVQLPNFRAPQKEPSETNGWSLVQEGMLKTLTEPHTGMAITIDVGEEKDIHPKDKQSVGHRLAQWALADVYKKEIVAMGPIYRTSRVQDGQVVIEFDHADGLHSKADQVQGFAICGEDKTFVWADAVIDGPTVTVSHDQITQPVAVRYAWAANPVTSLFNSAGIPASPFRTDTWEERGR